MQYFAHKEYKNDEEKNEFFNSFIRRVILFDDKIIIVYNTGSDEEISIDNTELLNSINGGENPPIVLEDNKKYKSSEREFKRLALGGADIIKG